MKMFLSTYLDKLCVIKVVRHQSWLNLFVLYFLLFSRTDSSVPDCISAALLAFFLYNIGFYFSLKKVTSSSDQSYLLLHLQFFLYV